MASLRDLKPSARKQRLTPTSIDGLYVLALKRGESRAYSAACLKAEKEIEDLEQRANQINWLTLNAYARSENGERFEDIATVEAMLEIDDAELRDYERAIVAVVNPGPKPKPKPSQEAPKDN